MTTIGSFFETARRHPANGQLASYETIKRFRVLRAQFSIASGELTPTLKLKRKVVSQKYAREIEELFGIA